MSGIYIKGMEMPTSCAACPMLEGDRMDGLCHAASRWLDDDEHWLWYVYPEGDVDDSKPCNCPLFPVPDHGDLIDRETVRDYWLDASWNFPKMKVGDEKDIFVVIGSVLTIIPADKEGEG